MSLTQCYSFSLENCSFIYAAWQIEAAILAKKNCITAELESHPYTMDNVGFSQAGSIGGTETPARYEDTAAAIGEDDTEGDDIETARTNSAEPVGHQLSA